MSLRNRFGAFFLVLAFVTVRPLPLAGQSTTDSTCVTAPSGVTSFVIEHAVDVTTIKSTITPSLPPEVVGPIFSGAKEVRSRISYDNTTGVLANDLFLVDPGAPLPTPATVDFVRVRFGYLVVIVDKVFSSCRPRPSVLLVGTIVDGFPIFGNPTGAPYAFSFGYTTDTPPKFRDVVSVSVGLGLLYAANAPGSITFPVLNAVVLGGPVIATTARQIVLDATGSTGGPLTYTWTSARFGLAILDDDQPKTRVIIDTGSGDYPVTLTVRDARGEAASTTVIVRFFNQS